MSENPAATPPGPPSDAALLRAGCAVGARDDRALLEVRGADRHRFLNGYLTCDVQGLAAGRVVYGFFTSREGRVLADAWVAALEQVLRVSLPASRAAGIVAHLTRYLLTDRVELALRPELSAWHLVGPRMPETLAAAGLPVPDADAVEPLASAGGLEAGAIGRRDLGSLPGVELWLPEPRREATVAALRTAGAFAVSALSFEIARVEEGVAAFGVDFSEESFPQESGHEAIAVSYQKGCYLGQEVVARIHYRGGVQRRVRGVRFPGRVPTCGEAILHDGREAGRLTSVVRSPRCGAIGLAMLHHRVGEPPAQLALEGGGFAELVSVPFGADRENGTSG